MMSVLASLMPNAAYVKDNPGFVIPEIKTASSDNGKTQLPGMYLHLSFVVCLLTIFALFYVVI